MLIQILLACVTALLMVVLHELGHILTMYIFNGSIPDIYFTKRYIEIGEIKDYIYLYKFQYNWILLMGVLSGLIPLFIFGNYLTWYLFVSVVIIYYAGCKEDIKNLINA